MGTTRTIAPISQECCRRDSRSVSLSNQGGWRTVGSGQAGGSDWSREVAGFRGHLHGGNGVRSDMIDFWARSHLGHALGGSTAALLLRHAAFPHASHPPPLIDGHLPRRNRLTNCCLRGSAAKACWKRRTPRADNASRDRTLRLAEELAAGHSRVRVVHLDEKGSTRGHGPGYISPGQPHRERLC